MELLERLKTQYPEATCTLDYGSDFELLISVILSAQCTDKRVNIVTEKLFKVANTPQQFCDMDIASLESFIHSCGFYREKAKHIKSCCYDLVHKFNGVVPSTFDELITLSGVGRKTANVMLALAFDKPAIAVDTHVFRVARRLGLSAAKTPKDVESDLKKYFDESDYRDAHLLLITFGRECCKAQKPNCADCPVTDFCKAYNLGAKK